MAVESFAEHYKLPGDLSWKSHQHSSFARHTGPVWPSTERARRVLTRNYGGRVVVCLPLFSYPNLERSTPVFTDIMATESGWSPSEIATLFNAVEQHLEPNCGLGGFHYGVQYNTVQTFSNTPERFVEDLKYIEAYESQFNETSISQADTTQTPSAPVGAGVWPTKLGWFYVEATQRLSEVTYEVRYGLLRRGPLFDPADVIPFFKQVSDNDERPRTQGQWPLRQLMLSGQRGSPLSRTEGVEDEFCPETLQNVDESDTDSLSKRPSLPLHGTNPLFGTELSTISTDESLKELRHDVYDPLRSVSTLAYDPTDTSVETAQFDVDKVIAMEPPTLNSLFVTAVVKRSR